MNSTSGGRIERLSRRGRAMSVTVEAGLLLARESMREPVDFRTGLHDARRDARQALRLFARVEEILSRFRADSELNRVAAASGRGEWSRPSPTLAAALRASERAWRETGGLFNPNVRTALERWGYDETFERLGERNGHGATPPANGRVPDFLVEWERGSVRLATGTPPDLGGIGKGLTVDWALRLLTAHWRYGWIDGGGDLRFAFPEPRPVSIAGPDGGDLLTVWLREGAVATSGTTVRRAVRNRSR